MKANPFNENYYWLHTVGNASFAKVALFLILHVIKLFFYKPNHFCHQTAYITETFNAKEESSQLKHT